MRNDLRIDNASPENPDGRTVRFAHNEHSKLHGLTGTLLYPMHQGWATVEMHDDGRVVAAELAELEEVTGY